MNQSVLSEATMFETILALAFEPDKGIVYPNCFEGSTLLFIKSTKM